MASVDVRPTLTEFLLARIAEDEGTAAYAQTSADVQPEDWGGWWFGHQQHYSRHDPGRVLAECEAKRQMVDLLLKIDDSEYAMSGYVAEALCIIALPYAGHPNYRDEWKPSP